MCSQLCRGETAGDGGGKWFAGVRCGRCVISDAQEEETGAACSAGARVSSKASCQVVQLAVQAAGSDNWSVLYGMAARSMARGMLVSQCKRKSKQLLCIRKAPLCSYYFRNCLGAANGWHAHLHPCTLVCYALIFPLCHFPHTHLKCASVVHSTFIAGICLLLHREFSVVYWRYQGLSSAVASLCVYKGSTTWTTHVHEPQLHHALSQHMATAGSGSGSLANRSAALGGCTCALITKCSRQPYDSCMT